VEIATTDRRGSHAHEDFARLGDWIRLLMDDRLPIAEELNCLHGPPPRPAIVRDAYHQPLQ
jgi:hypothetical protein